MLKISWKFMKNHTRKYTENSQKNKFQELKRGLRKRQAIHFKLTDKPKVANMAFYQITENIAKNK